ncbi:Translation initiation factor IF-2, partial [Frankliniella fusca]
MCISPGRGVLVLAVLVVGVQVRRGERHHRARAHTRRPCAGRRGGGVNPKQIIQVAHATTNSHSATSTTKTSQRRVSDRRAQVAPVVRGPGRLGVSCSTCLPAGVTPLHHGWPGVQTACL